MHGRWRGFAIRALPQTLQSVLNSTLLRNSLPTLRFLSTQYSECYIVFFE
jgi:hypothetical protein